MGCLTPPIIYLDTRIPNIDFLHIGNQRINANMVNRSSNYIDSPNVFNYPKSLGEHNKHIHYNYIAYLFIRNYHLIQPSHPRQDKHFHLICKAELINHLLIKAITGFPHIYTLGPYLSLIKQHISSASHIKCCSFHMFIYLPLSYYK